MAFLMYWRWAWTCLILIATMPLAMPMLRNKGPGLDRRRQRHHGLDLGRMRIVAIHTLEANLLRTRPAPYILAMDARVIVGLLVAMATETQTVGFVEGNERAATRCRQPQKIAIAPIVADEAVVGALIGKVLVVDFVVVRALAILRPAREAVAVGAGVAGQP